jgi:A/G-specific adenine glycosylase
MNHRLAGELSKHMENSRDYVQQNLIIWYRRHHRSLPWRKTSDPYRIWVSEVMLQQTQVRTVVPYYDKFIKEFPSVFTLATADLQQVLKAWEGMGYYARARNLHRAAKQVIEKHGGKIPRDIDAFRGLPGVGEYIASAVQSIAFQKPCAVVDGNVKRVLARLFEIKAPVNKPSSYRIFKDTAKTLLNKDRPGLFNQAVMEIGALVCKPKNPECSKCPLQSVCRAFQTQQVNTYPLRIQKKPVPTYHIAAGVVFKNGDVLITQRKPEGLLGGLWEFPGGKFQRNETAEKACARAIKEEVNLTVEPKVFVTRVKHAYTHFKVVIYVYCCRYVSGIVKLNGATDYRWIPLENIDQYPFHKANHKFIPLLKQQTPDT